MLKVFIAKLKEEGWTQEAIAEKVGVRQNQISTLAKGGDCKASTLLKFAKAFEKSIDEIIGLESKERKPMSNCIKDEKQKERKKTL